MGQHPKNESASAGCHLGGDGKEHTTFQVAFIFKHFFPLANHSVVDGRDLSVQLSLADVLSEEKCAAG